MLIAFWAPLHGQCGTTSNMFTSAFIMGLHHDLKVLMMHTQSLYNNLEGPLTGKPLFKKSTTDYKILGDIGIDALVRNCKVAPLTYAMIEGCSKTFEDTNVMLLPGTYKDKNIFEKETKCVLTKLFKYMNENIDVIMIDVNSGDDDFSNFIMEKADLIVVNLPQNMFVTKRFFETNNKFDEKENVFYLFGRYDDRSKSNINNIRRSGKFPKINKNNSGVIPFSIKFMDAQSDQKVIEFINQCLNLPKKSIKEEYYFIHKSKLAVEKMLNILKINIREEDKEGEA